MVQPLAHRWFFVTPRRKTERLEKHVSERRSAVELQLAQRCATLEERREHLDVMRRKAELPTQTTAAATNGATANIGASRFAANTPRAAGQRAIRRST